MALANRWLLPDGVKELLPPQARQVELLRRKLLDLYDLWGYELVMPPLVEHLESLMTGVGRDLDLNTYKLIDQISGKTLGVRADITPQVARIDAHCMSHEGANRLCYCGSVVHTRAENMLASRNPLQVGAELYGHAGLDSDIEVISLMLETLMAAGINSELSLDLGHVGVFRGVMSQAGLSDAEQAEYMTILSRKALPELASFVAKLSLEEPVLKALTQLPSLSGGIEVLASARALLEGAPDSVREALDYLQLLAERLAERYPQVDLYFDLSELRGYNYHTGVVFAALSPLFGQPLAKGGRYDSIGSDFGRSRPATGFSADLKNLCNLSEGQPAPAGILAPAEQDPALHSLIAQLRAAGERVVQQLPGDAGELVQRCDRVLVNNGGEWQVQDRPAHSEI